MADLPAPVADFMGKGSATESGKGKNPCAGVCNGKASCWVNALCSPCVLPARSCLIYVLPCVDVYLNRVLCGACVSCPCFTYTDSAFPADDTSIGELKSPKPGAKWRRGAAAVGAAADDASEEARRTTRAVLVRDGITPSDIGQGALGDCWLMSAFACLAEFPGAIENLFLTREVSPRGKYSVRLFDDRIGTWRVVSVDDCFPCDDNGTPASAPPHL